jgi:hypothetical protein
MAKPRSTLWRLDYLAATGIGEPSEKDRKAVLRLPPSIKFFQSKEWRSLQCEFYQFQDDAEYPKPKGGEPATA